MALWKKVVFGLSAVMILGVGGAVATLLLAFPKASPPEALKVESTPVRLERGRYLAHAVAVCMDCHGTRDWTRLSGPMVPGSEGRGGEVFGPALGLPGTFVARNLTPAHLGTWSDGELLRAITEGISRDGRPLFPIMPHPSYGRMDREDVLSVIAYLRSLPSQPEPTIPETTAKFPFSLILRTIPAPAAFEKLPQKIDKVAYGAYLTRTAACADCHTPMDKGKPLPGLDFAGGNRYPLPGGGAVRAMNITPDVATGIGAWSEDQFVQRFKNMLPEKLPTRHEGPFNTLMPWSQYAQMTEEDLRAIYAYLRTVPAVQLGVERYEAPK